MTAKSVLVVDDDPSIRRVVAFWLQAEGLTVILAETGEQALKTLLETPIDTMVTDVRLPGIDGATLAHLANRLDHPPPHVYLMSAFPPPEHTEAERFFRKPDQLGDLVQLLLKDA